MSTFDPPEPDWMDDEPEFDDPDIDELRCLDCDGHHPTASCPYTDKD